MQTLDLSRLPDDPKSLKALLIHQVEHFTEQLQSRESALTERDTQLEDQAHQLSVYETELRYLREQVQLLLHKRFAASSEKHNYPGQQELFDEAELEVAKTPVDPEVSADERSIEVPSHTRRKRGRKALPEHLPRVEVIHDLAEEEKFCAADGHPLHRIGEEVSERLEIIPAKVRVIRHIRPKYACRQCETGVRTAPLPSQVIPGSIATPGLLAYVAVSKYADALPLHRQSRIFSRIGVDLHRRTLAEWMLQMARILDPLRERLRAEVLQSRVLQMDETRVQVLKEPGKKAESQSYMWVMISGGYDPPGVCYHYDPSRSGEVPSRLLANYRGYLVSDGYAGYGAVTDREEIIGVGCWAHARRKFDEALRVQGKSTRVGRAQVAMNEIRKLYAIEREIQQMRPAEKHAVRQARAKPIADELRAWCDKSLPQVPPKTTLGKALHYLDQQWPRLVCYLDDGELPIDNNRCENAIRPFVIGRRNWLFSNSQAGARASATLYSLIESAKLNDLEPYRYLRYVLTEMVKGPDDPARLLPWNLDSATIDC